MDAKEKVNAEKQPAAEAEATETTPSGLEVRTPSRAEFFANLRKASKPEDDES